MLLASKLQLSLMSKKLLHNKCAKRCSMRLLQIIFIILWIAGYLGNGILFLFVEWSFIHRNFIQIFNPLLQLQVLAAVLSTPLFWIFLVMALIGYYAATSIDKQLARSAKPTQIQPEKYVPSSSQVDRGEQSSFSPSSSARREFTQSHPPEADSKQVYRVESGLTAQSVELLEWALQSSQKVQFNYEKRTGEKSNRIVTPTGFKTIERTLCLEGYCHLRRAKRTFAIRRMRDIKIVSPGSEKSQDSSQTTLVKPYPDTQKQTRSIPQPPQNVSQTASTEAKSPQRPYIKCSADELEKITDSAWNNQKVLSEIYDELEFRSRKKSLALRERISHRLSQLQNTQFVWPTTTASEGIQNLPSDTFKYEKGLLRRYGYKVGKNGLSQSERWEILDAVFLRPLLQMENTAYLSEWGQPNTARRLQKLAESIAAFTRNAKRRNLSSFSKAIEDWETDLAYLKRTYYNNRFSFQWPRT
jgi:hypothetical protein